MLAELIAERVQMLLSKPPRHGLYALWSSAPAGALPIRTSRTPDQNQVRRGDKPSTWILTSSSNSHRMAHAARYKGSPWLLRNP